jgi:hypothetical protein
LEREFEGLDQLHGLASCPLLSVYAKAVQPAAALGRNGTGVPRTGKLGATIPRSWEYADWGALVPWGCGEWVVYADSKRLGAQKSIASGRDGRVYWVGAVPALPLGPYGRAASEAPDAGTLGRWQILSLE